MKRTNLLVLLSLTVAAVPTVVFANSSWYWISEQRPWDILPWVAMATIFIEVLAIWLIPATGHFLKTAGAAQRGGLFTGGVGGKDRCFPPGRIPLGIRRGAAGRA